MTLLRWQGALQVITQLGDADGKLNIIICWIRWCCLTTGRGRITKQTGRAAVKLLYNEPHTGSFFIKWSKKSHHSPSCCWVEWTLVTSSSNEPCAFMTRGVILRYLMHCGGSSPKQLTVTCAVLADNLMQKDLERLLTDTLDAAPPFKFRSGLVSTRVCFRMPLSSFWREQDCQHFST